MDKNFYLDNRSYMKKTFNNGLYSFSWYFVFTSWSVCVNTSKGSSQEYVNDLFSGEKYTFQALLKDEYMIVPSNLSVKSIFKHIIPIPLFSKIQGVHTHTHT